MRRPAVGADAPAAGALKGSGTALEPAVQSPLGDITGFSAAALVQPASSQRAVGDNIGHAVRVGGAELLAGRGRAEVREKAQVGRGGLVSGIVALVAHYRRRAPGHELQQQQQQQQQVCHASG